MIIYKNVSSRILSQDKFALFSPRRNTTTLCLRNQRRRQFYNNRANVIIRSSVQRHVEHFLCNQSNICLPLLNNCPQLIDRLVIRIHIPQSIARNKYKLVLLVTSVSNHKLGQAGHQRALRIRFQVKVAEGARHRQQTIHTVVFHEATILLDSSRFPRIFRLMVFRQSNRI